MCFVKGSTKARQEAAVRQQEADAIEATRIAQQKVHARKVKDLNMRIENVGGIRSAYRGSRGVKVKSKTLIKAR